MPTVTASVIIGQALAALNDVGEVRWSKPELLGYLSDGQREAVSLKPSLFTKAEVIQLAPGTRQLIPDDGVMSINVVRNMGEQGDAPGRSVREVERGLLDSTRPYWHSEASEVEVELFCLDDRDRRSFYVVPPQPVQAGYVELLYSAAPPQIADEGDPIALDDSCQTALYYYVMHRALTKASSENPQSASMYYQQFIASVTGKTEALARLMPRQYENRTEGS